MSESLLEGLAMEVVRRKKTWTVFSQKAIRGQIPSVFRVQGRNGRLDRHWRCDLVDLWALYLDFSTAADKGTLVHALGKPTCPAADVSLHLWRHSLAVLRTLNDLCVV